jgi:hypothetical protein
MDLFVDVIGDDVVPVAEAFVELFDFLLAALDGAVVFVLGALVFFFDRFAVGGGFVGFGLFVGVAFGVFGVVGGFGVGVFFRFVFFSVVLVRVVFGLLAAFRRLAVDR